MKELEPNRDAGHVDHSLWHKICANMHELFNQGNTERVGYIISYHACMGEFVLKIVSLGKSLKQTCGSFLSEC